MGRGIRRRLHGVQAGCHRRTRPALRARQKSAASISGAAVAGTYTAATGVFTATTGATYLTTFVITNGAGATLTIGGETYTADANGVVGVALAAGTHDYTIMKAHDRPRDATVSTAAQIIEVTLVSA